MKKFNTKKVIFWKKKILSEKREKWRELLKVFAEGEVNLQKLKSIITPLLFIKALIAYTFSLSLCNKLEK